MKFIFTVIVTLISFQLVAVEFTGKSVRDLDHDTLLFYPNIDQIYTGPSIMGADFSALGYYEQGFSELGQYRLVTTMTHGYMGLDLELITRDEEDSVEMLRERYRFNTIEMGIDKSDFKVVKWHSPTKLTVNIGYNSEQFIDIEIFRGGVVDVVGIDQQ